MAVVRNPINEEKEEKERLMDIIRETLPQQYHTFSDIQISGPRATVKALWGPGNEKRRVKIDRNICNIESPRGVRHTSRGYTTSNDISILTNAPDKEKHAIVDLVDYYPIRENGFISVEREFGKRSLEERLKDSPLSEREFVEVYKKSLEAVRYSINELGIYHRDLSTSNTLIDEKDGKVTDVRITDWANAGSQENVSAKPIPTAGKHWFTDPLLIESFTGKQREYSTQADMYSIGIGMLASLTGKYSFEYDPDTNMALETETGENLLDSDGKLQPEKHNLIVQKSLNNLPNKIKKRYGNIISKLLTLDEKKRYSSIDDLINDFENSSSGGLLGKIKKAKGKIATGLAASLIGLGLAGGVAYHEIGKRETQFQQELKEQSKYLVTTDWDGYNLEISNNVVETDERILVIRNNKFIQSYEKSDKFVKAEPGDRLSVSFTVKDTPWPLPEGEKYHKSPVFNGKVYLEGFDGEKFGVYSMMHDTARMTWERGMNVGGGNEDIEIPKDLPDGTYTLAMELYAPLRPEMYDNSGDQIKFETPGKVVSRDRIPVVVGNPQFKIKNSRFKFDELGDGGYLSVVALEDNRMIRDSEIDLEVNIYDKVKNNNGEYSFKNVSSRSSKDTKNEYKYSYFDLFPDPKEDEESIAQLVVRSKEGKVLWHTYIPIIGTRPYKDKVYGERINEMILWNYNLPGEEFSTDIIGLDKKLYERE